MTETAKSAYAALAAGVLACWVAAAWVGFRMLGQYNDGRMDSDDALLTMVAVTILALGATAVFVCVTLWAILERSAAVEDRSDH